MQYVTFCTTDELPPGSREVFDLDSVSIVLFNVDGTFYAIENMCSHEEYELFEGELDGYTLECPQHGAQFDIRSGDVLRTPAYYGIRVFPVRVDDNEVQVGVELE